MHSPRDAVFEFGLDSPRPTPGRVTRLLLFAGGITAVLAVALGVLTLLPFRATMLAGVLVVLVGAGALAIYAHSRSAGGWTASLERELSESRRRQNRARITVQRTVAMAFGALGVCVLVVAWFASWPAPIEIFAAGFALLPIWVERNRRRLLRAERIDDPAARVVARGVATHGILREMFWIFTAGFVALGSVWFIVTLFGLAMPAWLRFVLQPILMGQLAFFAASPAVTVGWVGRWTPAHPHCAACGYLYDELAQPVRCSECGQVLTESTLSRWRKVRSPRYTMAGVVWVVIGISLLTVPVSPGVRAAILTRTPTTTLIAQVVTRDNVQADDAWAELQTRLPLIPRDRDRLIEGVVRLAIAGDELLLYQREGIETWLGANWPAAGNFAPTFGRLLAHLEQEFAHAGTPAWEVWEAAEVLFAVAGTDAPVQDSARMRALADRILHADFDDEFYVYTARQVVEAWDMAGRQTGATVAPTQPSQVDPAGQI